jgi:hypothetical protein
VIEELNLAIRAYTDALSVHNFEQANRWAEIAFAISAYISADAERGV